MDEDDARLEFSSSNTKNEGEDWTECDELDTGVKVGEMYGGLSLNRVGAFASLKYKLELLLSSWSNEDDIR